MARACRILGLARSTYYYRGRSESKVVTQRVLLRDEIEKIALRFPKYGYRRITAALRKKGWTVNAKAVLRVMRQESLLCHVKRAFLFTTDSKHEFATYPNLTHGLKLVSLDQVWVSDITYVKLAMGFAYVAVILDRLSRRVIGWAISDRIDVDLTLAALNMALRERRPRPGTCIHHSDRGVQYASRFYVARLNQAGIRISMSKRGSPYDNAAAESFMKTLKHEEVYLKEYRTHDDIRKGLPHFLESVYNRERLHSSLDYLCPVEFEHRFNTQRAFKRKLNTQEIGIRNLIP